MNRTEFLSLIEHPENSGSISLSETEKVIHEFPYWQSARLIYVKALQQKQHFSYQSQLKLSAIYAGDRKKFFELINKEIDTNKINGFAAKEEETETPLSNQNGFESVNETSEPLNEISIDVEENEPGEISSESNSVNEEVSQTTNSSNEIAEITIIEKDEIENDLSKIIEQRIQELTKQNTSYGITEPHDEENIEERFEEVKAENVKSNEISKSEDVVSMAEESAAFDVYEETSTADDLFKVETVDLTKAEVENIIEEENKTEIADSEIYTPTQHSFLEWFKVLKNSESESEGESAQIVNNKTENKESQIRVTQSEPAVSEVEPVEMQVPSNANEKQETETDNQETETNNQQPETDLISRFIQEEPRIQPKKNAFFSPSVAARQSVVYDEDFVSETLAEIFHKQQLHDKAIKAYEKLTLMFPEKSTLFAARIQKIKEESRK